MKKFFIYIFLLLLPIVIVSFVFYYFILTPEEFATPFELDYYEPPKKLKPFCITLDSYNYNIMNIAEYAFDYAAAEGYTHLTIATLNHDPIKWNFKNLSANSFILDINQSCLIEDGLTRKQIKALFKSRGVVSEYSEVVAVLLFYTDEEMSAELFHEKLLHSWYLSSIVLERVPESFGLYEVQLLLNQNNFQEFFSGSLENFCEKRLGKGLFSLREQPLFLFKEPLAPGEWGKKYSEYVSSKK